MHILKLTVILRRILEKHDASKKIANDKFYENMLRVEYQVLIFLL